MISRRLVLRSKKSLGNALTASVLASLGLAGPAYAATICTVTATTVSFGIYLPLSSVPDDSTGTISVDCRQGLGKISYTIALSTGSSGTFAARTLRLGSDTLNYNFFTDAARTLVWGNGLNGSTIVSDSYVAPGSGANLRSYTVFGRVPARQNVRAGQYADSITVTVDY
jgi:spore coat protein U-like protein